MKTNKILFVSILSQNNFINKKNMMNNIVKCKYPTPDSDFKLFETDKDEPLMCIQ